MASLFEDSGGEEEGGAFDLKVDPEFEERYLERKRREELSRLKDKGIDVNDLADETDSDSEEEDDDARLLSRDIQKQFFTIIPLIRNKDPSLRTTKEAFFSDVQQADGKKEKGSRTRGPKFTLGHLVAKNAMETRDGSDDEEDEDGEEGGSARHKGMSYNEEQEQIRKDFMKSFAENVGDDGPDGDGLLMKKGTRSKEEEDLAFEEWKSSLKKEGKLADKADSLEKFWNVTDEVDEGEKFLRDYILNERWRERPEQEKKSSKRGKHSDSDSDSDSGSDGGGNRERGGDIDDEDDEHMENAERFESDFNFRHAEKEGQASDVVTYPRKPEESVRSVTGKRKKQRERKKEREELEKTRMREEIKRLKHMKKQELEDKLRKAEELAGLSVAEGPKTKAELLMAVDLESDFDPDKYDEQMSKIFDDDYYDVDDEEFVPEAKEDDEDDDDGGNDEEEDDDGDVGKTEGKRTKGAKVEDSEQAEGSKKSKKDKKRKSKEEDSELTKKAKDILEQEFDEMDFEDVIAGSLKTRFRYTEVKPNAFGYTTEELLSLPEPVIKERVSIKRLATYREKEYKPFPRKKKVEKLRMYELKKKEGQEKKKRRRRPGELEKGDWDGLLTRMMRDHPNEDPPSEGDEKEKKAKTEVEKKAKTEEEGRGEEADEKKKKKKKSKEDSPPPQGKKKRKNDEEQETKKKKKKEKTASEDVAAADSRKRKREDGGEGAEEKKRKRKRKRKQKAAGADA